MQLFEKDSEIAALKASLDEAQDHDKGDESVKDEEIIRLRGRCAEQEQEMERQRARSNVEIEAAKAQAAEAAARADHLEEELALLRRKMEEQRSAVKQSIADVSPTPSSDLSSGVKVPHISAALAPPAAEDDEDDWGDSWGDEDD